MSSRALTSSTSFIALPRARPPPPRRVGANHEPSLDLVRAREGVLEQEAHHPLRSLRLLTASLPQVHPLEHELAQDVRCRQHAPPHADAGWLRSPCRRRRLAWARACLP